MSRTPPTGTNLILIGMPGSGKSSAGRLLAQQLGLGFIDLDREIELRHHANLQTLVNRLGLDAFCAIEEETMLALQVERSVISTGGSVVYSAAGMAHLQRLGWIIWLDVPRAELERRIHNMDRRGLVIRPDQSFSALYQERQPLYRQWADHRVCCPACTLEGEVAQLRRLATTLLTRT